MTLCHDGAAVTGETGSYTISRLTAGQYRVSMELPGFVTATRDIALSVGDNNVVDFTAKVLPTGECVPSCLSSDSPGSETPEAIAAREAAKLRPQKIEHTVAQMWDFSMQQSGIAPGNGRLSDVEQRKIDIRRQLREFDLEAIPALLLALDDPDSLMRRNAALVLLDFGGGYSQPRLDIRDALPVLIRKLNDPDSSVQGWSAQAIGEMSAVAAPAVPALIHLLETGDEGARNSSCIALGKIGPIAVDALPALRKALNDSSPDVRRFAAQAITKIQN